MAWCFSTRASVATVLTTHPCVSRCLRVNHSSVGHVYTRERHKLWSGIWHIDCLGQDCSISIAKAPEIERIMYVLEWRTVSALTRGLFWCLFPNLRSNERNKYQNNTRLSTEKNRHESTYIILFLKRHNESINDDKNGDLYTSSPCLTRSVLVLLVKSQSIADDVTMTRQLWHGHVNSDI